MDLESDGHIGLQLFFCDQSGISVAVPADGGGNIFDIIGLLPKFGHSRKSGRAGINESVRGPAVFLKN